MLNWDQATFCVALFWVTMAFALCYIIQYHFREWLTRRKQERKYRESWVEISQNHKWPRG